MDATHNARLELRRLLDGGTPTDLPPQAFGPWADYVCALREAHAQGGTQAVRATFNALASVDPSLITLVAAERERKTVWTARELLEANFPEPAWIVPGLLPVGLTCLGGRPKVGKSWLLLQIAHAVAVGGEVFGRRARQGRVLYLALEDRERRLRQRLIIQNVPVEADITFITEWPLLDEGGLVRLQTEIEIGRYLLTCIDTFARIAGRADQDDIATMTIALGNLQQIAETNNCGILLADHHRKAIFEADPIDDLIGSTAKAAVIDTAWGLYRPKGRHECVLKIIGRDVEERELALQWDPGRCIWQLLGEADQVRRDSVQAAIVEAIKTLDLLGAPATTAAIAEHLGRDQAQVSRELAELLHRGIVMKLPRQGKLQPYALRM